MTVLGPPPAAPASTPQPQAPAETPAVVTPPEADQSTSFIDPALLNDAEAAVVDAFQRRQDSSQGPSPTPDAVPAPEVTGGETGDVTSPAIPPTPPVATPAPDPTQVAPEVTAPAVPPAPEVAPASTPPVPDPLAPAAPEAYDPFAIPAPPAAPDPALAPPAAPALPGYTPAQIEQMQATYQWAQGLTPEESSAINQFIQQNRAAQQQQGQPAPIQPPANQPIQQQPFVPPPVAPPYQPQQPPGPPQPVAAPPTIDFAQVEDPNVAAYLQQQQAWQAQQQQVIMQQQQLLNQFAPALQDTQQMAQAAFQQQQQIATQETNQRLDQARWDFAVKYQLSSADMEVIEQRLTQSNLVPELISRRQGDVYSGIIDGFETVAWTAPDIRPRMIQTQVAPAIEDAREIQNRAARLGALSGQGGTVPHAETTPVTAQDRHRGMVAALEAAMNNQPS